MNNNNEFTFAEMVDIMVALGHMETQCKEWVDKRNDETNVSNLNRVTELKNKVNDMVLKRIEKIYN